MSSLVERTRKAALRERMLRMLADYALTILYDWLVGFFMGLVLGAVLGFAVVTRLL